MKYLKKKLRIWGWKWFCITVTVKFIVECGKSKFESIFTRIHFWDTLYNLDAFYRPISIEIYGATKAGQRSRDFQHSCRKTSPSNLNHAMTLLPERQMRFCQDIKIALGCYAARHCVIKRDGINSSYRFLQPIARCLLKFGISVFQILPMGVLDIPQWKRKFLSPI